MGGTPHAAAELLVRQGQGDTGTAQLHQDITAYGATGAEVTRASHLLYLADAYGAMGQPADGLEVLTEAQAWVDKTSDRWREAEPEGKVVET